MGEQSVQTEGVCRKGSRKTKYVVEKRTHLQGDGAHKTIGPAPKTSYTVRH